MANSLKLEELMCQWTSDFEEEQGNRHKPSLIKVTDKKRSRTSKSRHPNLRTHFPVKKKVDTVWDLHVPPSIRDLCDADKARIAELIKELGRVTSQKDEIVSKMKYEKESFENQLSSLSSEKQNLEEEQLKLQSKLSKTESALTKLQEQLSDQITTLGRDSRYNTCQCLYSETSKTAKTFTEQIDAELRKEKAIELSRSAKPLDQCTYKQGSDVGLDMQHIQNRSLKTCSYYHECSNPSTCCNQLNGLGGSDRGRMYDCNCNCQKHVCPQDFFQHPVGTTHYGDCSRQVLRGHHFGNCFTLRNDEDRTSYPNTGCFGKCSSPRIQCHAAGSHASYIHSYRKNFRNIRRTERTGEDYQDQLTKSSNCFVGCSTPIHSPKEMCSIDGIPGIHEMKVKTETVIRGDEDSCSSVLMDTQIDEKNTESVSRCHSADIDQRIAEIDARHSQSHRELLLKEKEVLERERRCVELLLEQQEMRNPKKSASAPNTHRSRVIRPGSAHSVHSVVIKPGLLNRCDSRASSRTPTSLCESINIQLPETEEETTTMSPNNFARCDRYTRRPGRSPPSPPSSILDIVDSMNGGDVNSEVEDEEDENRLLEDVFFVKLL